MEYWDLIILSLLAAACVALAVYRTLYGDF